MTFFTSSVTGTKQKREPTENNAIEEELSTNCVSSSGITKSSTAYTNDIANFTYN